MQIVYNGFIYEANRNIPTEKQILEKYKDKDNYFYSYRSMNKVGINPNSGWNTPNGIYTYSFKDMGNSFAPYKGSTNSGYIYVLKIKDGARGIDSETYSKDDFYRDFRLLAETKKSLDVKNYVSNSDFEPFPMLWKVLYEVRSSPNNWSKLLLGLGYSYVRDRCTGTIHRNEPCQTVFIGNKGYEVVEYGIFGDLTLHQGKLTDEYIRDNGNSFTQDNANAVAKHLLKDYNTSGYFNGRLLSNVKPDVASTILHKVLSSLDEENVDNILDDWKTFSFFNLSDRYMQHLIKKYPNMINTGNALYIMRSLNDKNRFDFVTDNVNVFEKITYHQPTWLDKIPHPRRLEMLELFSKEFNIGLEKHPNEMSNLIYQLRPMEPKDEINVFKMLENAFRANTIRGFYNWLGELFYQQDNKALISYIILHPFKEEFKKIYNEGDTKFINYFNKGDEHIINEIVKAMES